ncbi:carbamoyltransferase [Reyranella sp.]|uniref:carbamoyltransferase family protein n=1 Tax=Reyranella sp. TaxID=1929291 RepID=UPI003BAA9488
MTAPYILGISGLYHDSAAAIVRGGEIVAAAQEERFTRRKHDRRFPANAVNYCLGEAFVEPSDLELVAYYDNPWLTFDRVLRNFAAVAPRGREPFGAAMRSVVGEKFNVGALIEQALGTRRPVAYVDHHLSHAASAFYPSPFESAAVLTIDGVGEHATLTMGHGRGERLELLREIRYPHSLGLLYSAITQYCGFKVNSGEYKLMGLAPYGEPRFADLILKHLIDVKDDGSFALDLDYFAFMDGAAMSGEKMHALFGAPPREPESRIELFHMDVAASIQAVTEEIMLRLAREARRLTGERNLALAGGVALNCVGNGKILRSGIVDGLWIQPAAGDAGGALGAALYAAHMGLGVPRPPRTGGRDSQHGSYLGPAYSSAQVRAFLDREAYPYARVTDRAERARRVAEALASGKVVGLLSGRMEFGPRSLGARSILADPRGAEMQSKVNLKVKYRESFRPFAPAVLDSRAGDFFELEGESPYMLLVAPVREAIRQPFDLAAFRQGVADMIPEVNKVRSTLPAITHVDYSARVQTVSAADQPDFHAILQAFEAATGCPVLVNTSFNVRGEPIVNTPQDAYRCFMRTDIDLLVLEDCLLEKAEQPASAEGDDWRKEFVLD